MIVPFLYKATMRYPLQVGMKTDRIRSETSFIIFVFIFFFSESETRIRKRNRILSNTDTERIRIETNTVTNINRNIKAPQTDLHKSTKKYNSLFFLIEHINIFKF